MKIGGIVAEYNPFHNGHAYQIQKYKKNKEISHLVVAMSGNFIQRGGPSIFDKYSRAEMAIRGGADLVIEIPSFFATQTAELFARGAIMSLAALGCLESICFGVEDDSLDKIYKAAELIIGEYGAYEESLQGYLRDNKPFAVARSMAIMDNMDCDEIFLRGSNNILAIEYVKEMKRVKVDWELYPLKRVAVGHLSMNQNNIYSSASYIRENFKSISKQNIYELEKKFSSMPLSSIKVINKILDEDILPMYDSVYFEDLCMQVIREEEYLNRYFELGEGLDNLIRKEILRSSDIEEFMYSVSSKRYTRSKIRRALFNILLGISKDDMELIKSLNSMPYIRVLGFNKRGTEILKEVNKKSDSVVVKSPAKIKKQKEYEDNIFKMMLDFDIRSSNMYYQKYYKDNRAVLKKGEPDFITLKYMI